MRNLTLFFAVMLLSFLSQNLFGQEDYENEIEHLKAQKEKIIQQEKDALKKEVKDINQRLDRGALTVEEAKLLKAEVAKKRALNIENRVAIIENKILLIHRNRGEMLTLSEMDSIYDGRVRFGIDINGKHSFFKNRRRSNEIVQDRRTYSDLVVAFGLNNALIHGESFSNSPYKYLGSRFFEIGYAWNTRVFKNSNWLRLKYGLSFQFNGLKPTENRLFLQDGNSGFPRVVLTTIPDEDGEVWELSKSKFRMDSFIVPIHFEFGPSTKKEYGDYYRYSTHKQFKMGVGGYVGFNYKNVQKVKSKTGYFQIPPSLSGFGDGGNQRTIFGLSSYMGFDDASLYFKYELTQIFPGPSTKQNNISLGLRFDL
ncbi:hypothetical protein [Flagellimonas sp. 2504JD1-5]